MPSQCSHSIGNTTSSSDFFSSTFVFSAGGKFRGAPPLSIKMCFQEDYLSKNKDTASNKKNTNIQIPESTTQSQQRR